MNRLLITLLMWGSMSCVLLAQVPQGFSYQAVARDANGVCLSDTLLTLRISILDNPAANTPLYQEKFENIPTNEAGLFHITIGTGNPENNSPTFSELDWRTNGSPRFLEVQLAPDNTNNLLFVGTTQLMTVPFAMAADDAINADSSQYALLSGNGLQIGPNNDQILHWYGNNGLKNGALEGAGTSFDNGIIRLYDDTEDELLRLAVASLNGGEDYGALTLLGDNGNANMILGAFSSNGANRGAITWRDDNGSTKAQIWVDGNNVGNMQTNGPNGQKNVEIDNIGTSRNYGRVGVYDDSGSAQIEIFPQVSWDGAGRVIADGPNGNINIEFSVQSSQTTAGKNRGALRAYNEDGDQRAYVGMDANGVGYSELRGANGNRNVLLSSNGTGIVDPTNYGSVAVQDEAGNTQARMYVNWLSQIPFGPRGYIEADIKNFVMDHPSKPNKEIVYTCIEGPEVAAYERGTAQLVDGEAVVSFSETFEIVANPQTMTVILTPRSPDAKGLAAFEYTATGFKVKELFQGSGSYSFDWEVKAVRKGYESFPVIRDKPAEHAVVRDEK